MAIPSAAVWEARSGAANSGLQGGFYNAARSGTDYSQQDSAQLSLADLATDGAGTGISSATGGFTAAMAGNGIYLTGGGVTAGWYEIVSVADTNNATIDRSAGLSKTGATGRVGGAVSLTQTANVPALVAGNKLWVKADATYTLANSLTLPDAAEGDRIVIEGYGSTRGDEPTGDNRPLVSAGAYYFLLGGYTDLRNFRITGTATGVLQLVAKDVVVNVRAENTSGTAGRAAFRCAEATTTLVSCEALCTAGYGISMTGSAGKVVGCYIHDCGQAGIYLSSTGHYLTALSCVFDTCVSGISGTGVNGAFVAHCIFYGNTSYGFVVTTGDSHVLVNNIFSSNGTAVAADSGHNGEEWEDWNDFYGNTADRSGFNVGPHSVAVDPQFSDAANADFTVGNSALRNVAIPVTLPGSSTTNYADMGLQQQSAAAAAFRTWAHVG